jgi:hypothetical protein
LFAGIASAQVTLYGQEGMRGRSFTAGGPVDNLAGTGFNDRAASMIVERGEWEVCEDSQLPRRLPHRASGPVPVARRDGAGQPDLVAPSAARLAALRVRAGAGRAPRYDYYPRYDERLYQADVSRSARSAARPSSAAGSSVSGSAATAATRSQARSSAASWAACSATRSAAGAARTSRRPSARSAARRSARTWRVAAGVCAGRAPLRERLDELAAAYYDVTYVFRGQTHRAQLGVPPGPTIAVNGEGEPRV